MDVQQQPHTEHHQSALQLVNACDNYVCNINLTFETGLARHRLPICYQHIGAVKF